MKAEVRRQLLARLANARAATDEIFALVRPDSLYERPVAERNRIIFYLGHLEAFDWNLLQPRLPGLHPFDPSMDRLFAFGIDPVDGGLPADQPADWPRELQVRGYQSAIRDRLDQALAGAWDWDGDEAPTTILNVAIEHRLMHAETLTYMLHQLPYDHKIQTAPPAVQEARHVHHQTIPVPYGLAALGLSRDSSSAFGWDNEFERHVVEVPAFEIDEHKITNGQFLDFIRAGGYRARGLWTEDGWQWKEQAGIRHPAFWKHHNAGFLYRGMFADEAWRQDLPVFVSHSEASAYAVWRGRRLPTESEWRRYAGANTAADGWEWTSTLFAPFAGFRPFTFYAGYSADFFDGKHYVLKGGSASTAVCMLRPSFRNWFQPHYPYLYAGFRCASGG